MQCSRWTWICVVEFVLLVLITGLFIQTYSRVEEPEEASADLTIFLLTSNSDVRQCLVALANDTGLRVELTEADTGSLTDFETRRNLNMALLAERGPDIIVMDDMDAEPYRRAGVLQGDMVPLAQSWFVISCRGNMIEPSGDITSLLRQLENRSLRFDHGFDIMAAMVYRIYVAPGLSGDKEKDSLVLKHFFSDLKHMRAMFRKKDAYVSFWKENLDIAGMNFFDRVASEKADVALDYLTSLDQLQELSALNNQTGLQFSSSVFPTNSLPRCMMAVTTSAAHRQEAERYLKYARSEAGQETISDNGLLPASRRVMFRALRKRPPETFLTRDLTINAPRVSAKECRELSRLLPTKCEEGTDGAIMQLVMQKAQSYMNGSKSLTEATEEAADRIWLKWNE